MRNPPSWQLILALSLLGVAAVRAVAAEELGPNLIRDGGMEAWNAVGDGDGKPRVIWKQDLTAAAGAPILADLNADGNTEIIVPTSDGYIQVFDHPRP